MNSTLQCLRAMPELESGLNRYVVGYLFSMLLLMVMIFNDSYQGSISGVDSRGNLTASLRDLFKELNKAGEGFPPLVFWQVCDNTHGRK